MSTKETVVPLYNFISRVYLETRLPDNFYTILFRLYDFRLFFRDSIICQIGSRWVKISVLDIMDFLTHFLSEAKLTNIENRMIVPEYLLKSTVQFVEHTQGRN